MLQNLEGQAEAVADSHNVPWGSQAGDAASKGWFDLQLDKAKKALEMPGGVLDVIADEVNPTNSGDNCGHIIDAVIARLRGTDPKAVAQAGLDGSWADILKRYNTKIQLGISFDEAFKRVREGGNGTIAIIGIVFKNGLSHVVVITNDNGAVGIVEGQSTKKHPKKVIYTAEEAYERYNRNFGGIASIGYAAIPP